MADLYHASYRRLVAQVYAFTTDLTEAQDAVSEAFARALARRGHLSDIDAPEAWLRTVAVNIVKRKWRRKQLLDRILLRERPVTRFLQEAPEPDRADLREALGTIPRTYREVIVLHYLADLPVDEVAAILEVPVGTVKSRLSRGREALKGLLDDVEAPPLSQVQQRAGTIKKRRRVAQATASVAVVLVSAVIFFPWSPSAVIGPTQRPTPSGPVLSWQGSGLGLRSLPDVGTLPDLPGVITDFDLDLLRTDAEVQAKSADGGQTWEIVPYQQAAEPEFPWHAKRKTPRGVWWAARVIDGKPAVGYLFDSAGWQWLELPGAQGNAVTATLMGEELYVLVLNNSKISSGYRGDASRGFKKVSGGDGRSISGEPIVLPDGRVLIAGTHGEWLLSNDQGATWSDGGGTLPWVGSFRMVSRGYAALNLFDAGWVAVSTDGAKWQKLPIR